MADWESVRSGVGRAANKAAKKTGEVADVATLYVKLKMTEAKLDGYYTALGKLTYKQLKSGESQAEKIKPIIEGIDKLREKASALRQSINEQKEKRRAANAEAPERVHLGKVAEESENIEE